MGVCQGMVIANDVSSGGAVFAKIAIDISYDGVVFAKRAKDVSYDGAFLWK